MLSAIAAVLPMFNLSPVPGPVWVNGAPVEIILLAGPIAPGPACRRVEQRWNAVGEPFARCRPEGRWVTLTRLHAGGTELLQLRAAGGGSEGFWSRVPLLGRLRSPMKPRLPLPAGARAVNVIESGQGRARAATHVLSLRMPVHDAAAWFQARALAHGWLASPGCAVAGSNAECRFSRNRAHDVLLLRPAGGVTSLVLLESAPWQAP